MGINYQAFERFWLGKKKKEKKNQNLVLSFDRATPGTPIYYQQNY